MTVWVGMSSLEKWSFPLGIRPSLERRKSSSSSPLSWVYRTIWTKQNTFRTTRITATNQIQERLQWCLFSHTDEASTSLGHNDRIHKKIEKRKSILGKVLPVRVRNDYRIATLCCGVTQQEEQKR